MYSPSLNAVSYWHIHEMLFVVALLSASTLEAISQLLNIIQRQFNAYLHVISKACASRHESVDIWGTSPLSKTLLLHQLHMLC